MSTGTNKIDIYKIDISDAKFVSASGDTGNCVEVAKIKGIYCLRDSKLGTDGPVLRFTEDEWAAHRGSMDSGQH